MLNIAKTAIVAVFVSGVLVSACSFANAGTYIDALRECATEWKASDVRKAVVKGTGVKAWNDFRADCVKRIGYDRKRGGNVAPGSNVTKAN